MGSEGSSRKKWEELASVGASIGICGKDLDWSLKDGILMITGSGPMYDFQNDTEWGDAPWWDEHESIKQVIIGEGITRIGNESFLGCLNLTSVTMHEGIKTIGTAYAVFRTNIVGIVLFETLRCMAF